MLQRRVGAVVWLLVAFVLARLVWSARGRGQALATAAAVTRRAALLRSGKTQVVFATLIAVMVLPFVLPWTVRARGEFRVEAAPRTKVHAEVEGVVDRMHVEEGAVVEAGAVLASLWNPRLEAAVLETRKRVDLLGLAGARADAAGDRAGAASAAAALAELESRLAVLEREHERLTIRAPQASQLEHDDSIMSRALVQRFCEAFEVDRCSLMRVDDRHLHIAAHRGMDPNMAGRVRLPLAKSRGISAGQRASLKFSAWPGLKFVSQVTVVSPAAREGWLEAEVFLPDGPLQPQPGMTGVAKVVTARGTIAAALARAFRENVRLDLWL